LLLRRAGGDRLALRRIVVAARLVRVAAVAVVLTVLRHRSYPFELLPSDCGRARVWLCDPVERRGFGLCGSRSSPCFGESILLTSSWPFLTTSASLGRDSCLTSWHNACW